MLVGVGGCIGGSGRVCWWEWEGVLVRVEGCVGGSGRVCWWEWDLSRFSLYQFCFRDLVQGDFGIGPGDCLSGPGFYGTTLAWLLIICACSGLAGSWQEDVDWFT